MSKKIWFNLKFIINYIVFEINNLLIKKKKIKLLN